MRKTPFFIIGNWKSNKTIDELVIWCRDFETLVKKTPVNFKKVQAVLCVPFIHLTTINSLIMLKHLPFALGAQTLSSYPPGAYTGEISAEMLKGMVSYCLIGHSERRKYFKEEDSELALKVKCALTVGIEPIYCIQEAEMEFPPQVTFVGYEPLWAIGTGKAESPENANTVAKNIKARANRELKVIYGGSVTPENVATYVTMDAIDGVLPGGASLKPDVFHQLLVNASST